MNASSGVALITDAITDVGVAIVAILGAILTIGIGMLVFYFGWRKTRGVAR